MSISFQLNLTPNQIEFLQCLDLYADGLISLGMVPSQGGHDCFITWARKLIREGLIEHVTPRGGERYEHSPGQAIPIKAYKITEKGKVVLGLIEADVNAFLARQKSYQKAKKAKKRRTA